MKSKFVFISEKPPKGALVIEGITRETTILDLLLNAQSDTVSFVLSGDALTILLDQ